MQYTIKRTSYKTKKSTEEVCRYLTSHVGILQHVPSCKPLGEPVPAPLTPGCCYSLSSKSSNISEKTGDGGGKESEAISSSALSRLGGRRGRGNTYYVTA